MKQYSEDCCFNDYRDQCTRHYKSGLCPCKCHDWRKDMAVSKKPVTNTSATPPVPSSVKLEGRAKGPPSVTVHIYNVDPEEAASQAIRLWFDTSAQVAERYTEE